MMLTIGDAPAIELKAGDVAYLPANVVHFGRNVSDAPVRLILFRVKPTDQPLMARP
jgi:quercetin dioxygenase-like cupin family protein